LGFVLDASHEPVVTYLEWVEQLRLRVNRELFLSLFDYECHYAHYPMGHYKLLMVESWLCMWKMVLFLSEEFPHEVLPAMCSRYSLTAWFRINATDSVTLDPLK